MINGPIGLARLYAERRRQAQRERLARIAVWVITGALLMLGVIMAVLQ